jgi:hypothetical protein
MVVGCVPRKRPYTSQVTTMIRRTDRGAWSSDSLQERYAGQSSSFETPRLTALGAAACPFVPALGKGKTRVRSSVALAFPVQARRL